MISLLRMAKMLAASTLLFAALTVETTTAEPRMLRVAEEMQNGPVKMKPSFAGQYKPFVIMPPRPIVNKGPPMFGKKPLPLFKQELVENMEAKKPRKKSRGVKPSVGGRRSNAHARKMKKMCRKVLNKKPMKKVVKKQPIAALPPAVQAPEAAVPVTSSASIMEAQQMPHRGPLRKSRAAKKTGMKRRAPAGMKRGDLVTFCRNEAKKEQKQKETRKKLALQKMKKLQAQKAAQLKEVQPPLPVSAIGETLQVPEVIAVPTTSAAIMEAQQAGLEDDDVETEMLIEALENEWEEEEGENGVETNMEAQEDDDDDDDEDEDDDEEDDDEDAAMKMEAQEDDDDDTELLIEALEDELEGETTEEDPEAMMEAKYQRGWWHL